MGHKWATGGPQVGQRGPVCRKADACHAHDVAARACCRSRMLPLAHARARLPRVRRSCVLRRKTQSSAVCCAQVHNGTNVLA